MRANQNFRGSAESVESSVSEATSTGSSVAPRISGKQPLTPRQIGGGSKSASALARRMMSDPNQHRKGPMNSNEPTSLRENQVRGAAPGASTRGPKSEMAGDRNLKKPMVAHGSWDDLSTDDTHKDISGASDLPEDQRDKGENTSSDTEDSPSSSPNISLSAMQHRNALAKSNPNNQNRPEPNTTRQQNDNKDQSQAGYNNSRVMVGSRPAAKQKDRIMMEQANKLSVRATENVPASMVQSRTPNLTQQQRMASAADNPNPTNEAQGSQNQPIRREKRSVNSTSEPEKVSPNTTTESRHGRQSTKVFDPNNPTARPVLRGQDSPDGATGQNFMSAAKRSISSSPQQRMRQPLIGQQRQAMMAKTTVYTPGGQNVSNDASIEQHQPARLRSQSAEAVNVPNPQGRSSRPSPSISALQNIKRQYASAEGPLTSSPKPARSTKTQDMVQSSSDLLGSNADEIMSSNDLAKKPWSLDEIDTAIDRLLQEDTAKLMTEAEVTNAIDKV